MANDAHKLIAVSLGKIAQARQCKSGLNLRRNLLVASVLHRARYVYVSELRQRQYYAQQNEPPAVTDQGCVSGGGDAQSNVQRPCCSSPADDMAVDEPPPCRADAEPSPPVVRPEVRAFNKENTPPAPAAAESSAPVDGDAVGRGAREDARRARKRAAASDGSDLASPDDDRCAPPLATRRCVGLSDNDSSGDGACQQQTCCDSATLVDPVQINNLVQIFNASLTNLTAEQQHGKDADVIVQPPVAAATACATELKDCAHVFGRGEALAVTA